MIGTLQLIHGLRQKLDFHRPRCHLLTTGQLLIRRALRRKVGYQHPQPPERHLPLVEPSELIVITGIVPCKIGFYLLAVPDQEISEAD